MSKLLFEEETYKVIGACMEVHKILGNGFLEPVYQEVLAKEFGLQGIPFEREKRITISYKGDILNKQYLADFVCFDKIIVELKALSALSSEHESQLLNYLKATGCKVGLLVNFGEKSFKYKRMILTKK
ncbi:GxxExxY protein [candidate division WOR-3 bacterium]|nr:GxxExxY protein [candidate division WOR-3 bacterium]